MLSVSNAAMTQLSNTLQSVSDGDDDARCFRIVPKDETNLTLSLAKPTPTDMTFEHDGNTVLAVPEELHDFCDGKSLDVNDDGKLELA
jgi:hypothetical protein